MPLLNALAVTAVAAAATVWTAGALDAPPPAPAPGTGAQTWACAPSGGAQAWYFVPAAASPGLLYVSLDDGRVLTVADGSNETGVQLSAEHRLPGEEVPWQLWTLTGNALRSALNGHCAAASDPIPGVPVSLARCNDTDALQQWASSSGNGSALVQAGGALGDVCLDVGSAVNCSSAALRGALYCNASAPAAARATDLAARLTVYDLRLLLGGWYQSFGVPRLGLPRVAFAEALHGLGAGCGRRFSNASYATTGCPTSFPHATLSAAAFNRSLWRAVGDAVSTEARGARGGLLLYTPDINTSRDQRWGRAQEVPGEDPLLAGEYAAAFVAGLQAAAPGLPLRAAAHCKHWAAYDFEGRSGADDPSPTNVTRHTFDANVTLKDLAEYFFPPFEACVRRGGAVGAMSSINAVNGVPGAANANFTVLLLRGAWGFDGYVTSDCGTVSDLQRTHHYVATPEAAVAAAVAGGTDWNCGTYYNDYMVPAMQQGAVPLAALQAAAARFLRVVFAMGLADDPATSPYAGWGPERVDSPPHRALALQAALQGAVLLRNDPPPGGLGGGAPLLPLSLSRLRSLAVVSPHGNASAALLSNYAGSNSLVAANTPLLRLRARADAASVTVAFAPGVPTADSNDTSGVAAAAAAAASADVTLAFLGLDQPLEREGLDRVDLLLPPAQRALLAAVTAAAAGAGKALAVVLLGGGAVSEAAPGAAALVAAFYPGEYGGEALAQLLLGEAAFSGRLPVTIYEASWAARRAPTDMALAPHTAPTSGAAVPGATYWYVDAADTLFPFGAGLSYSQWALAWAGGNGNVTVDAAAWASGAAPAPAWTVNVTNTGNATTSDVSTLGFFSPAAAAAGGESEPRVKLFDFVRAAAVPPGGSARVTLALPAAVAARVDVRGTRALVPGVYGVRIGGDAAGGGSPGTSVTGWLTITGAATVIDSLPWVPQLQEPAPAAPPQPPVWTEQPVRGWNSWTAFGCGVTASDLREAADALVATGLAAAGYRLVAPDDCWAATRAPDGTIVADAAAFPEGMAAVAAYVAARNLSFGIYTAIGNETCAHRPGSAGYEAIDAATYASWGVRWAKIDNCDYPGWDPAVLYGAWRTALDAQPYRIAVAAKAVVNYSTALTFAASHRVGADISASWGSLLPLAYMAEPLWAQARPGDATAAVSSFWTDVELLQVGNGRLTENEAAAHFWLWCALHAPLMLSTRLAGLSAAQLELLTNAEALAINHDALGGQARRVALAPAAAPALPLTPTALTCSDAGGGPIAPGQAWRLEPQPGGSSASASWVRVVLRTDNATAPPLCLQRPACNGTVTVDACPDDPATACEAGRGTLWSLPPAGGGPLRSALGDCLQLDCGRGARIEGCHPAAADQALTALPATGQLALLAAVPGDDFVGYPLCLDAMPATHTEVWAAPLTGGDVSVLLLNPTTPAAAAANVTVDFAVLAAALRLPPFAAAAAVRDVGARADLGPAAGPGLALEVPPHGARFLRLTPAAAAAAARGS